MRNVELVSWPSIFCVKHTKRGYFCAVLASAICPRFGFAFKTSLLLSVKYFHTSPGLTLDVSMLEIEVAL